MILSTLALAGLLVAPASNSISFKKINPDSVLSIRLTDGDMYSASTISAIMKDGRKIRILYDKQGRFDPRSLLVGLNKSWFSIGNPFDRKPNDFTCIYLVCSLNLGACNCSEILSDPGYKWLLLDDSGSVMVDKRNFDGQSAGHKDTLPDRTLSEAEMVKRFQAVSLKPNKPKETVSRKK